MTGIFIRDAKLLCLQVRPLQFNTKMHVCCPPMFRLLTFLPSMFLEPKKFDIFEKYFWIVFSTKSSVGVSDIAINYCSWTNQNVAPPSARL